MSKKKMGLLSLVMMLILVMVTACGGEKKEVSLGTTEKGSYTNDYFGLSVSFPTEWEFQDSAGMNELMNAGVDAVVGDDKDKKKRYDLSLTKTLNLLMASKYPLGGIEQGGSIMIIAEKVSLLQGVKSGEDYLKASRKIMEENQLPYEFKEITTTKVGGKDMDVMQVLINAGDMVATQEYYSIITEGYALNIITTYFDDESKAETDKIIKSVTFK